MLRKASLYLFLFTLLTISSSGADPAPAGSSLGELRAEKESLTKNEEDRRTVLSDLYRLNTRISRVNRERGQFESQRSRAQDKVQRLSGLVSQIEKKIEIQRIKLMGRMRSLYKFGGEGFLRLAFSSESSADFDLGMKFIKMVVGSDYALLKDYRRNIAELETQRSKLKDQVDKLRSIEQKVRQKESQLVEQQKDKGDLLGKLNAKQMLKAARIKILRLQAEQTEVVGSSANKPNSSAQMSRLQALQSLLEPSFFERRGSLPMPVAGNISIPFGDRKDTEFSQISLKQRGIIFKPNLNFSVGAVFKGTVAHVGPVPGFGRTLILDHGDHYYSVYSNLGDIFVRQGTLVDEGQSLGNLSRSDVTNSQLYFELRHFSEALDPSVWFSQH